MKTLNNARQKDEIIKKNLSETGYGVKCEDVKTLSEMGYGANGED